MYAIFSLEERISPALVYNITLFEAAGRENSLIAEGKSVIGARKNPFLAAIPCELVPLLPVSPLSS
jgi:hypothetical protein